MNLSRTTMSYEDLHSQAFQQKLAENPNAVILDVRTPEEFHSGRIPESVNINVMDKFFMEKVSALDKTKTYFVYCRSGGRSGQACAVMARNGFEVYNLAGGIGSWTGIVC